MVVADIANGLLLTMGGHLQMSTAGSVRYPLSLTAIAAGGFKLPFAKSSPTGIDSGRAAAIMLV